MFIFEEKKLCVTHLRTVIMQLVHRKIIHEGRKANRFCSSECHSICDFCQHFEFNGKKGVYVGKGYCRHYQRKEDPGNGQKCKQFICINKKRV